MLLQKKLTKIQEQDSPLSCHLCAATKPSLLIKMMIINDHNQSAFLLDLCSHVKNYETQTGRSYLPALQSVFQSPDVWIIDLSQRKISVLLEVLKLQTEKKPVELIRCSEEEREVMSFLQCLKHISQLR